MSGKSLTGILKNGFLAVALAVLTACGGGSSGPPPPTKSLFQTASLVGDTDIDYRAKLTNVSQATRERYHNGSLVDTLLISIPNYSQALSNNQKGTWRFELKSSEATTHTTSIDVPNYNPSVDFSSLQNVSLNERYNGSSTTLDLASLVSNSDKNLEDRPVPLTSATVLSGGVSASIIGYNLTITATGAPGPYRVEVNFGKDDAAGRGSSIISGQVLPVLEQIVFWGMRQRPGEGCNSDLCEDVYRANVDGTGIQRLTTHTSPDLAPAVSPDGNRIVFVTHRDGDTALSTMNAADGSDQRRLTGNLSFAHWPDWCSDGKILFRYENHPIFGAGIASINPDGTGFTPLVIEATATQPSCSPEGSDRFAFETFRDGNWEVYVRESNGTQRNITNNPMAVDGQPAWSLDNRIAFVSDRDTLGQVGELDLYLINLNGAGLQRLTSASGRELDASWSPDGTRIAFARFRFIGDDPQLYVMNSDVTGNWTQITTQGANRFLAWRPR